MVTATPTASSMLGISSNTNSGIGYEQTNNTVNTNIGTKYNDATNSNGTLLLSAIFKSTSSYSSSTFFNASLNLSTSSFAQTTVQAVLNWSSGPEGHESSLGHTTSPANVSFHFFDVSPASTSTAATASPLSMRVAGSTKVTSSPAQSTPENTWDSSVIIAAALFILALTLVAVALRILVPIYHHIMGHNESKEPRERHPSVDRDPHGYAETRPRGEMTPSTHSEEVLIPFGTPATHMQPVMNYGHMVPYQYPLTYMPYQGPTMWSPQAYEQDYIINQPIQHDIPPPKASTSHQADRLVEILDFPSDQLNMGAIYRHNWDQLFEGVANESMLSYVGHPSEYRVVPANHNTKP